MKRFTPPDAPDHSRYDDTPPAVEPIGTTRSAEGSGALPPLRRRRDGWTADRQLAFLDALRTGATVADAARSVGMSRESAYRLRRNPRAAWFIAGWALLDRVRAARPSLATRLDDPDRFAAAYASIERRLADRATRPDFDRFLIRRMNAYANRQPERNPV